MKFISGRAMVLSALCLTPVTCMAAIDEDSVRQGAGAALYLSKDNEGFVTQRAAIEYLPKYKHADSLTGFRYTTHHFEQNDWSRSGQQISILHRETDPATANGWQAEGGFFRQGQHDLFTADANYRRMLAERTGLELFLSRDWVETANALDKGIHFTFSGIALEQGLGAHVTVVGIGGRQNFSDGNARNHRRLKLIVQPDLDLGLTLQARYRAYDSSSENVGRNYFNPGHYEESMLALAWRKKIQGWNASVTAGYGQQKVGDDPRTATHLLEVGLQSPINRTDSFRMRGGLNSNGSFNGPNYRYRYLLAEWIIGFPD